jgi:SPFH domain/Band 7 family protein
MVLTIIIVVVVNAVLLLVASSIHVLEQYERAVQFRLGKLKDGARGPGPTLIVPRVDRIKKVSLRIVTMPIQSQGIITRDKCQRRRRLLPDQRCRALGRERSDQPDRTDHASLRGRSAHAR